MNRVANKDARKYVQERKPFSGSNTEGVWRRDIYKGSEAHLRRYVVTSYGNHFPLFIWDDGVWYENVDWFAPTTSKHKSQLHPHCETMPMTCKDMVCLMYYGIGGVAAGMIAGMTAEGNPYVFNPQTSRAAFVAPRSLEVASGFNLGEL
jgi:hypothetical protein